MKDPCAGDGCAGDGCAGDRPGAILAGGFVEPGAEQVSRGIECDTQLIKSKWLPASRQNCLQQRLLGDEAEFGVIDSEPCNGARLRALILPAHRSHQARFERRGIFQVDAGPLKTPRVRRDGERYAIGMSDGTDEASRPHRIALGVCGDGGGRAAQARERQAGGDTSGAKFIATLRNRPGQEHFLGCEGTGGPIDDGRHARGKACRQTAAEPPVQRPEGAIAAIVVLNEIGGAGVQRSQWPGA